MSNFNIKYLDLSKSAIDLYFYEKMDSQPKKISEDPFSSRRDTYQEHLAERIINQNKNFTNISLVEQLDYLKRLGAEVQERPDRKIRLAKDGKFYTLEKGNGFFAKIQRFFRKLGMEGLETRSAYRNRVNDKVNKIFADYQMILKDNISNKDSKFVRRKLVKYFYNMEGGKSLVKGGSVSLNSTTIALMKIFKYTPEQLNTSLTLLKENITKKSNKQPVLPMPIQEISVPINENLTEEIASIPFFDFTKEANKALKEHDKIENIAAKKQRMATENAINLLNKANKESITLVKKQVKTKKENDLKIAKETKKQQKKHDKLEAIALKRQNANNQDFLKSPAGKAYLEALKNSEQ